MRNKVFGLFVGIDKYTEKSISELGGCARDAKALSSIFADSVDELSSTLLVDESATVDKVLSEFQTIEANANYDDVAIVSFSGHGTDTHRFVCFDTSIYDISNSTIGMNAIANLFRNCKARVIIVLLDCCFSGGAASRVWETGVKTRNSSLSLHEIAGTGRIILTASQSDEEAIEDSVSRHGLFTSKLIEQFTSDGSEDNPLSLFGEIQNQVRIAAQRMGHKQNPRFLGDVSPSFRLPKLVKGKNFFEIFPQANAFHLSGPVGELIEAGIPGQIVSAWQERFSCLNALQLRAANDFGVLQGNSLIAIAPTTSGKTFVGEMAAARSIAAGEKVVILLPYKALVNEKFDEFQNLYGKLGYRIVRSSGDWHDQNDTILKNQYDIAFFTYETFLSLLISTPHILQRLGLIILDEAQFISDKTRGIIVELILTALVAARQREIAPQLVCLSAVIGDTNRLEEWLGAKLLRDLKRPVPLIEGVISRSGQYRYLDENGNIQNDQLIPSHSVRQRRNKASSQDLIVPLISKLAAEDGEKVLVFRNTRGSASGAALYLARDAGIAYSTGLSDQISSFDRSARSNELAQCVESGVAFHTSDLTREERSFVEKSFRDQHTSLNVLVATSTVAAGVNTPASTVIIAETEFFGSNGPIPFTVSHYKNMAGRAGRLGYETKGQSILLAGSEQQARQLFQKYVQGEPENVYSSFNDREIETWAIKLLAQVASIEEEEFSNLLTSTFGGYIRSIEDPSWPERIKSEVPALIEKFLTHGLIEQLEDRKISLTPLGTSCGRASFSISSALNFIEIIKGFPKIVCNDELLAVSLLSLVELDERFIPLARGRDPEAQLRGMFATRLPEFPEGLLQRSARDLSGIRRRCKKALVLLDWMSGESINAIEDRYSANAYSVVRRGDIVGLADMVRFHFRSAAEIVEIVSPHEEFGTVVKEALFRLEFGLPASAAPLIEFPIPLERGEILRLIELSVSDLFEATSEQISLVFNSERRNLIFEAIR